jgi:hypothetical protein
MELFFRIYLIGCGTTAIPVFAFFGMAFINDLRDAEEMSFLKSNLEKVDL